MITLDQVRNLEPPAIYDYEPKIHYELHLVDNILIKAICPIKKGKIVLGCTKRGDIIYIRDDLSPKVYDIILRHEKAHVNGWVHR